MKPVGQLGADGAREKDGQKLVLTAYESLPQPQSQATLLQLVAQQWAKLGVTLNVLAGDAGSKTLSTNSIRLKTPVAPRHGRPRRSGRDQEPVLSEEPRTFCAQKGGRATR